MRHLGPIQAAAPGGGSGAKRVRAGLLKQALIIGALFLGQVGTAPGAGLEVEVVNERGQPVAEAVVHATPLEEAGSLAEASKTAIVEQASMVFRPFVSAVQRGTRVRFPNNDRVAHHVYSFSPAKTFELPLYKGEPYDPVLFDRSGVVTLGCNIHDWMVAYLLVLDTPHYAVTRTAGAATIRDLEPGEYRVQVWHPGLKGSTSTVARTVTVGGEDQALRFSVRLRPERIWRPPSPL